MKCKPWMRHFQPPKFQCLSSQCALHGLCACEKIWRKTRVENSKHWKNRGLSVLHLFWPKDMWHLEPTRAAFSPNTWGLESGATVVRTYDFCALSDDLLAYAGCSGIQCQAKFNSNYRWPHLEPDCGCCLVSFTTTRIGRVSGGSGVSRPGHLFDTQGTLSGHFLDTPEPRAEGPRRHPRGWQLKIKHTTVTEITINLIHWEFSAGIFRSKNTKLILGEFSSGC